MPKYDNVHFDPPAPSARVILRSPQSGATVSDVPMLIDTGADVTLLPRLAVDRLGLTPLAEQGSELTGFDGSKQLAPTVELDVIFLRRRFQGRFVLIDDECGILGRNVLNHLTLLFDGPRKEWSEHVP
jgi:predicted aspartyl protease